jgi:hypothetical protein
MPHLVRFLSFPLLVPLSAGGYNAPVVIGMASRGLCHVVTEVMLLGCLFCHSKVYYQWEIGVGEVVSITLDG